RPAPPGHSMELPVLPNGRLVAHIGSFWEGIDEVFARREHIDPTTEIAEGRPIPPACRQSTHGDHPGVGGRPHRISLPVVAGGREDDEALQIADAPFVD